MLLLLCSCNYGPAGNIAGNPVYLIGEAATACQVGTEPKNGLCAE